MLLSAGSARYYLVAGIAAIASSLCFAFLLNVVEFKMAGLAASISGLAFIAAFLLAGHHLCIDLRSESHRPLLLALSVTIATVFAFSATVGLLTDVFSVPSVLSAPLAMVLSLCLLVGARWIDRRAALIRGIASDELSPSNFYSDRRRLLALCALIALLFAVRSFSIAGAVAYLLNDASIPDNWLEMERSARSLALKGSLADPYRIPTGPTAHVSPVYAGILAILNTVFGFRSLGAVVGQSLLGLTATAICMAFLPWLAHRSGMPQAAGWIGAAILAILPIGTDEELTGRFEQSISGVLVLSIIALVLALSRNWRDPVLIAATGIAAGVAALLSPPLLPIIVITILVSALHAAGRRVEIARASIAISCIAAVMVTPWAIRNSVVLGAFVPLRSNFGLELAVGNGPQAQGSIHLPGNSFYKHPFPHLDEARKVSELGEVAYMKQRGEEAKQWIFANPLAFGQLAFRKLQLFWFPHPDFFGKRNVYSVAIRLIAFSLISVLCLFFVARSIWSRDPAMTLLAAGLIAPTLIYLVAHVDFRYRWPIHPLSVLLAAESALWLFSVAFSKWKRSSATYNGVLSSATRKQAS